MTNSTLLVSSWGTMILAKIMLGMAPTWEFIIGAAPWVTTGMYYIMNFEKVNQGINKIIKKLKRK